jgi:hypothetical protein
MKSISHETRISHDDHIFGNLLAELFFVQPPAPFRKIVICLPAKSRRHFYSLAGFRSFGGFHANFICILSVHGEFNQICQDEQFEMKIVPILSALAMKPF